MAKGMGHSNNGAQPRPRPLKPTLQLHKDIIIMRFLKNTIGLFVSIAASGMLLMGCEEAEIYSIDSPDWMDSVIDSIADSKSASSTSGDTTFVTLESTSIGLSDCSAAWWTYFTQSFEISTGRLLHLEFVNHTAGAGNYQNWNLVLTNVDGAHSTDDNSSYFEYCVLRSDAYGWGGTQTATYPYESAYISYNYADALGLEGDDMWATWLSKMEGAYVSMDIDHSTTGYTYVTATMETTDGYTFVETFQQATSSSESVYAFIVVDGSYLEMKTAYTISSQVTEVEDQVPVSLTATGTSTFFELGSEDYIGSAVFTVTYADGTSEEVSSDDITFTVPDLTTTGSKVIIATYNTSKLGVASVPVSVYYTLTVTNSVSAISVKTSPTISTYYYVGSVTPQFDSTGLELEATYSDGTTGDIDLSSVTFSSLPAASGSQTVTATYDGGSSSVSCEIPVTMVEGVEAIGAADYSNGWWTTFTASDTQVTTSSPVVYDMYVYSDNLGNWHSPCVVLRDNTQAEYAVVRMDSYGWGGTVGSYDTATLESDWDWDTFMSNISGSHVVVTITATSDTTADIRYDVTYANGDTHYQLYSGITVDASNLYSALVTEESLLILIK